MSVENAAELEYNLILNSVILAQNIFTKKIDRSLMQFCDILGRHCQLGSEIDSARPLQPLHKIQESELNPTRPTIVWQNDAMWQFIYTFIII